MRLRIMDGSSLWRGGLETTWRLLTHIRGWCFCLQGRILSPRVVRAPTGEFLILAELPQTSFQPLHCPLPSSGKPRRSSLDEVELHALAVAPILLSVPSRQSQARAAELHPATVGTKLTVGRPSSTALGGCEAPPSEEALFAHRARMPVFPLSSRRLRCLNMLTFFSPTVLLTPLCFNTLLHMHANNRHLQSRFGGTCNRNLLLRIPDRALCPMSSHRPVLSKSASRSLLRLVTCASCTLTIDDFRSCDPNSLNTARGRAALLRPGCTCAEAYRRRRLCRLCGDVTDTFCVTPSELYSRCSLSTLDSRPYDT